MIDRRVGQVFGRAGGSLSQSETWASNRQVAAHGLKGERRTGTILDRIARTPDGPTVLHDLRIPVPGTKANIDHVVVSGNTIHIIDTKVWKPGFYWTLFGTTRRGGELFPHADKKTIPMAVSGLEKLVSRYANIQGTVARPLLVVWPSNPSTGVNVRFLRSPGAAAIPGTFLEARAPKLFNDGPGDPSLVALLGQLLIKDQPTVSPRTL